MCYVRAVFTLEVYTSAKLFVEQVKSVRGENEKNKLLIILTWLIKIVLEIMSEITRSETFKSAFSNAIIWMIPPSSIF